MCFSYAQINTASLTELVKRASDAVVVDEKVTAPTNATYHGLDLTIERRFAKGLAMHAAYTYSRSIDNTAEHPTLHGSNSFGQNGYNFHTWRGQSDYDVPPRRLWRISDQQIARSRKSAHATGRRIR